ncbi:polyprenyl synthetase family protein [Paenibacillus sp. 453mf]|uniref:polyprenyl synthetase family protein n=1 Tax=Paenibacillus sp. 453mf TaxID=1761874 RepID=UPI0008DEE571|nr:polyprenyl synthetase family protein [Paenibacillus sp. 453mf]SFS54713.1 Geranylgeranyl pyrophosphate synthase [Paenibacillus sp. 453mf]
MIKQHTSQAEAWYLQSEQKAAEYFKLLAQQVSDKSYVTALTDDFKVWKNKHIHRRSIWSFFANDKQKMDASNYHKYLAYLNITGKLDDYLDRSVSYFYLRDMGKYLNSPHTERKVQQMVTMIKRHLIEPKRSNEKAKTQPEFVSLASFYRWAQKEGVEPAAIWVMNKLGSVSSHIPEQMNAEQAQRKLIKIIFGVVMHVLDDIGDDTQAAERARRIDEAIRLGYSYGLTYPYIDDLLDSETLSAQEKERYSQFIRTALLTGKVPELSIQEWSGANAALMEFIHSELKDAFEYIKNYQSPEKINTFFEQSYVFFEAQDIDRIKSLEHTSYTNEELYLPVILKSASSRLIVRSVISAPEDEGFDYRTFYYGIYNQLADDFADMFEDLEDGAVTPYTYYLTHRDKRPDLVNPFELYWAVISNLIHNVYDSDPKTREVILDRAINGLKRCKKRVGQLKYNEIMQIFSSGHPEFNKLIQYMVDKAEDVDFFDKLLRDEMLNVMKHDQSEKEKFLETLKSAQNEINRVLEITKPEGISSMKEPLIDAANYSLEGGGKRLRPLLAWVMGVNEYGLEYPSIIPLLRSLEYMHTASLIFDDLPSQDNAPTRRGRATLHEVHSSATAELTGLFLIQKATEEQASLHQFDPASVLSLIQYSSQKAGEICMGQAMDLNSKGKPLTLAELDMICFYKTGIGFEASLVMPAILAKADEAEMNLLKKYAYHAGIAFQIKDDLLDAEGDVEALGKPVQQDVENNNSTFVTVLGKEGASKMMWDHYCNAIEALNEMPRKTDFLKHLLDYIINRNN